MEWKKYWQPNRDSVLLYSPVVDQLILVFLQSVVNHHERRIVILIRVDKVSVHFRRKFKFLVVQLL